MPALVIKQYLTHGWQDLDADTFAKEGRRIQFNVKLGQQGYGALVSHILGTLSVIEDRSELEIWYEWEENRIPPHSYQYRHS
jgi:hypothetical protein